MMEKISVIVPVYGVEKVLERCVDSILVQTYKNIEIVLVDDGSPDNCPAMCDAYAEKYNNIVVVHKPNGGLTSAWKEGVRHASGDLVGFVDSDDWIDADMYERLYTELLHQGADIAMAGLVFDYEDPNFPPRRETNRMDMSVYDRSEVEALFPVLLNDGSFIGRTIQPSRVTKLFRKKLVEQNLDLWDERVNVGEDLQMVFAAVLDADKICAIPDYYPYHYWYNMSSMTGGHDPHYLEKIKFLKERMEFISDKKSVYDFYPQIRNDFLSLAVMAVKNEIWRNHTDSFGQVLKNVRAMCQDSVVQEALQNHTMDKIGLSVKLYIFMMKHRLTLPCYLVTKVFFTFYYKVFSHK
ncbi:MAG: glycosyltransferase family 2 protein [Lachnospiraceae bacterium]|nr:glycosyltransferase family 2 protein [Lachnospiraceae bacterium]